MTRAQFIETLTDDSVHQALCVEEGCARCVS
jgi:hypothetical protein